MAETVLQNCCVTTQAAVEEWRPVVGYEGLYEVSSFGRIRSVDRMVSRVIRGKPILVQWRGRLRRTYFDEAGRPRITLSRSKADEKNYRICVLVAEAFLGPRPDGMVVCHNDGDNQNNRPKNLRYASQRENMEDSHIHGTAYRGERHMWSKLTEDDVREIRVYLQSMSYRQIARKFSCSPAAIGHIARGERWRHVV